MTGVLGLSRKSYKTFMYIMLNRLRGCARLSLYTFDARYACDEHGDEVRDATRVSS